MRHWLQRKSFRRNQAGLLDALLAAQPEANCDETFTRLRDQLRHFDGIQSGYNGALGCKLPGVAAFTASHVQHVQAVHVTQNIAKGRIQNGSA